MDVRDGDCEGSHVLKQIDRSGRKVHPQILEKSSFDSGLLMCIRATF
ncbi:hypothetical protein ES702_00502 [subsurface metagenome]